MDREWRVAGFVDLLRQHCSDQFPKSCPKCDRSYTSFREYVLETNPVGLQCFDSAKSLADPIGTLSLANCECGTTISVRCSERDDMYRQFLRAVEADAKKSGVGIDTVLNELRDAVRAAALK